jgi:poly-gamma-glutamate synthesis protein (capsule biosynthesis protein)
LQEDTPTPTWTVVPTPEPTSTSTPIAPPNRAFLWIQPELPQSFKDAVRLPERIIQSDSSTEADLRLEVGEDNPVSSWVYAFVAPFPEIVDGTSFDNILRLWKGAGSITSTAGKLYVDPQTRDILTAAWGEPSSTWVVVADTEDLVDTTWADHPSWAIVPFEQIGPRWKVLAVDGQSPLHKDFDTNTYPLSISISLDGSPDFEMFANDLVVALPFSNRDPEKLTTVVLTGVTALVRGTSNTMYREDSRYPAEEILPWLEEADILHVSNEVPFAVDCPIYTPNQSDELKFCTNPKYIELLEYIGTDVVELTGDHFADWGPGATLFTLEMYKDRDWPYYGGGKNLEDGKQAVLFEHNGNKIAFIGCNAKGGGYATADEDSPGAAECDYGYMTSKIRELTAQGYLVIATMQHQEYYTYEVRHPYEKDFEALSKAGAVIVSGSQAHIPQAIEFQGDRFIHFGLGNLFFDQYNTYLEARDAFIDRHVFYNGRYLGVELLTIRFINYARSRPMTPEERAALLEIIFEASGWLGSEK